MTDSEFRNFIDEAFETGDFSTLCGQRRPRSIQTPTINSIKLNDECYSIAHSTIDSSQLEEQINKTVKSVIDDYDDAREFSDERLRKLLKEQIKIEKEKEQKRREAKVVNQKKAVIDHFISTINRVEFNGPYTIIFWSDGSITRVKCQEGEKFDKEKGVALGIIKALFGDISYYNEIFKSLKLDEEFDKNGEFKKSFKPEQKHSGFKRIMRELFN